MSDFDRDDFEEVPIGESELPPVPPEFEEAASRPPVERPDAQPTSSEERNWAMGAHASALLTFILPVPGANVLAPLVVWLMKKDEMPFVDYHGKEAVNFNISFLIWFIAAFIVGILLFGFGLFLTIPVVGITWFVFLIIAAIKASNGEHYQYPLTIRFVK